MRRANGTGTIHKLSGNRRKSWRVAVAVGEKENGQVEYKTLGYFKHKHEAEAHLTDYHRGILPERQDVTLKQLYDEWSKTKFQYISDSTVDTYTAAYKHLHSIKDMQYQSIRTAHYQQIINALKLSRSSLHKIKTLSVQLNDYAIQQDIATKNYAKFIKLPKWEKSEKEIFTDAEIKKLKSKKDDEIIQTILILIYTGLRIGEMLSLTKFQVKNNSITTGSKTDAGQRVIPIHKTIKPFINSLFDTVEGLNPDQYRRRYYKALETAQVARRSPHACRHTFASKMARQGVDTLSIQKLMGHTDYALTANVYSHPDIEQLKKAIDKI